ncbi:MAG: cytochrome c3 family protein [Desulfuromonadaceae bacterium]|nr:cytochrome c3 family protein [Desulfuromonadaceae bacterium]
MGNSVKYRIGKILMDIGVLSQDDLNSALREHKLTKELIGETLVRMGILKAEDIAIPLMIQEHFGSMESAVKLAAGNRQLLGQLLVQSGHISSEQLEHVVAEQQRCGERIGDTLLRLGFLTQKQLDGLLVFQRNQDEAHHTPLRLGELLVSTGQIARNQLEEALLKQKHSDKNIGDILVEAGYVTPICIENCARLQNKLVRAVLAAILALGVGAEGYAGDMCTFSTQLQDSNLRAQYIAKVAAETGNMVAYNTYSDNAVASDAEGDNSASSFFFGNSDTTAKVKGDSSTLDSFSKDCLGCHDGVQAGDRKINYKNTPGQKSHWSQGSSEHPVGMDYASYAAMDPKSYKPVATFGSKMMFVNGRVGCTTCHDPLNPEKSHLAKSDYRSALCLTCHTK